MLRSKIKKLLEQKEAELKIKEMEEIEKYYTNNYNN